MAAGVLLDTSFLITLADRNRAHIRFIAQAAVADAEFVITDDAVAQAAVADAEFVITDDAESFYRYCETFKDAGETQFKAIKLEDGFDRALFDPNGQRDFTDGLEEGNPGQP